MNHPIVWPYPKLIAHRGAGKHAPENTLAAMRLGVALGYQMVEYDVKLSKDGIAILLHDDSLQRTSNSTACAGNLDFKELVSVDAGSWHSPAYAGEPIPTLQSIAAYTIANHIHSNIEIKPHTGRDTETGHRVASLAKELWANASLPPLLSSFSESALAAAMQAAPQLPRALLFENKLPSNWQERTRKLACVAVNLNDDYITKALVQDILSTGLALSVWTVNSHARVQQLFDWGCHAVFTEEIRAISPRDFP